MNDEYDIIIIGSGICGMAAAIEATLAKKKFIILEKSNRIGGHEYSLTINDKVVDIAFLFDTYNSKLHQFINKELNINTVRHRIVYSSSTKNNTIIHDNNDHNSKFYSEIKRLYKLTHNINLFSPYIFITCEHFLQYYNFSDEFITFVLKPAISILFLSGNEIGLKKPIPVIAKFLNHVISLITNIYNPVLWSIIGTQQITKQISTKFNIQQHIIKNTQLTNIFKKKNIWHLETNDTEPLLSKKIIFCCDTIEINRICKKIFQHPRYFFIKKYIDYCNQHFSNCYVCVHNFKKILPKKVLSKKNNTDFPYHYTYFKLGKWILSAVLADNIFLSVSLSKNLLHSNIPKKYILYKKKWRHPGQNTLLLAIVNSGILRNRNYNNLFFAGAGMYMIGHTYAYSSGREIGKIACSS